MNEDTKATLAGQIRVLLGAAAGFATGKGYVDADTATALVGVATALIPMAWSWWSHRKTEEKVQARVVEALNEPREEWTPEQRAAYDSEQAARHQ